MNSTLFTGRFARLRTGHFDMLRTGLFGFTLYIATGANAEELGRLFFTPEQRAQLESLQQEKSPDSTHSITVNGIVQKHGGARTVWINGIPQPAGRGDDRTPESVPVAVPGHAQPVKIKVGQKLHIDPSASAPPMAERHPAPSGQ
ncbi:MAG: hypothetical protein WC825_11865 [Gallionellaceae bacterium]|jgi:hypothetical protein